MAKIDSKWFVPDLAIAIPGGSLDFPQPAISFFVNECDNPECPDRCRKIVLTLNTGIFGFRFDFSLETGEQLLGELDKCYWQAKEPINAGN